MSTIEEIWKAIPSYEGYYEVSNIGNVRSLPRKYARKTALILKSKKDVNGYVIVVLTKDREAKHRKAHRLVALTFLPNPEDKKTVNHKNGIKDDNRLENLEWATASEQQLHARHVLNRPTMTNPPTFYGKKNSSSIRILEYSSTGELLKRYSTGVELRNKIGKSPALLRHYIKNGKPIGGKYYVKSEIG